MKRADFWVEITDPVFDIEAGRWVRFEDSDQIVTERVTQNTFTRGHISSNIRIFLDETWEPEEDWSDRIDQRVSTDEIKRLPIGSVLRGNFYTKIEEDRWESSEGNIFKDWQMNGDFLISVGGEE